MLLSSVSGANRYTVQPCWDKSRSQTTWRSYNYPHVTAVYWSLYRLARTHTFPSAALANWAFYLAQAINTTRGMATLGGYNQFGLMVGSVFRFAAG